MRKKYDRKKPNTLLKKTTKYSDVTKAVRSVFELYDDLLHDGWRTKVWKPSGGLVLGERGAYKETYDQVAQEIHRWFLTTDNHPGRNYQNALMTISEANLKKDEFDKLRGFLRKEIKRQVGKHGSKDSVEEGVIKWRGEHLTQVAAELEKDIGEIELESMRHEFERALMAREVVIEAQKDDFDTLCANLNLPTTTPPLQIASPDSNTNRLEADYRPEWRPFDFQKDKPSTSAQLVGGIALAGVATAVLLRKLFGKTPSESNNDSPSPR
jgi:hypothetical protein